MNKLNIILSGIVRNNPTFVLVLGCLLYTSDAADEL